MSDAAAASRVETTPRLAQWRLDVLSSFTYRKSDPFKMGLWNWHISVERSGKQLYVKLFPESSSLTRGSPPIASFITRLVYFSPPNQRTIVHPGICDKELKNDAFLWTIDALVFGRFLVEIEFLDLKVANSASRELVSIWTCDDIKSTSNQSALSSATRMLRESIHTDITINAVDGSVGAHRAMLSSVSPVFRSMFSHDLKEKELSVVDIPDMSLDACHAFLNYIYGNFRVDEFLAHRLALLRAADKYDVTSLRDACHESLVEDVCTGNVLERLQTAHLYRLSKLKSSCMRFLVDFRKIYEIRDELNAFLHAADRELVAEVFQEILSAWKGA